MARVSKASENAEARELVNDLHAGGCPTQKWASVLDVTLLTSVR